MLHRFPQLFVTSFAFAMQNWSHFAVQKAMPIFMGFL
jgi:hypothetical protein